MKRRSFPLQAVVLCSLVLLANVPAGARAINGQDKNKPKIPEAEAKAVSAIEAAPTVGAKIDAADEFVKKYPKSSTRTHVAEYIADQILAVADPAQKLALAQKFPSVFSGKDEGDLIKPALIDAYIQSKKFDEAFAEGATHLTKNGDDISVLINLTIAGVEQAKQKNPKYVTASRQYGLKAIEMFEANKKPPSMDNEVWEKQKVMLPQVYQEMAVVSLMEQNPVEAQARLEKAVKLNPNDPFNYLLLGSISNDEYQKVAAAYRTMADGKAKEETLQKANVLLDKVIDLYAHAVGLSEGKSEYQRFHDELLQDLSSYYRYRHNNSSDGLQKLIDSYKQP